MTSGGTPELESVLAEYQKITAFLATHPELREYREQVRKLMSPTPRDEVYREHSVALFRYRRTTPPTGALPLFVVPSLVNKPSVMDLLKGQSFVEAMLDRGHDVFMLEWGEPTPAQRPLSLHYYLDHYLGRAVRRARRLAGAPGVALAGYCLGGLVSLLFTALDRGEHVKALVTMVSPTNFKDKGLLSWWAEEEHFDIDKVVDTYGNVPAEFFASSFPWLVPTAPLVKARTLFERHEDRTFLTDFWALDIWGTENTDFPGEVYREIIKRGYQQNVLVKERAWPMAEDTARLADIRVPVLNLAAQFDHISPADSCTVLGSLLENAVCTSKVYPAAHLGIALGKDVKGVKTPQFWDEIASWLATATGRAEAAPTKGAPKRAAAKATSALKPKKRSARAARPR